MSEPGKIFIPLDFRNLPKEKEPFVFRIDEEDDPVCITLDLFTGAAHVQIKMDEGAIERLTDTALRNRLELVKKIAYRRGAAQVARRRRNQ